MSWLKLGRGFCLGLLGLSAAAACGGRGSLPTYGDEELAGESGSGGASSVAGNGSTGGKAGTAGAGGQTPVCPPRSVSCDASGTRVQVCSADGRSLLIKQDCSELGQRCQNGACVAPLCTPHQTFCDASGVRLCNDDGSGSSLWLPCPPDAYCDPKTLSCRSGVCVPNQPACDGSVATVCNANGSGYAPRGMDCAAVDRQCLKGACYCPVAQADCDHSAQNGCETDLATDPDNCAGCGVVCSATHVAMRTCNNGCNGACEDGYLDCNGDKQADGCEVDLRSDVVNCGGCGAACSANHVKPLCAASACSGACEPGFADCNLDKRADGCEVDTNSSHEHCGACGRSCANDEGCSGGKCIPLLKFTGVAQNVPIATLVGWTPCYVESYGQSTTTIAAVKQACAGSLLMMGCRPKGSSTLQLVAYAPRGDVLFDTGIGNTTHDANGVSWYFNEGHSWGFAPLGDTVTRSSCDIQDSSLQTGVDADRRLCWHTSGSRISGGWRCGAKDGLNTDFTYERLLFTAQ